MNTYTDHLTPANLALALVLLGYVLAAFKVVAAKTETKSDDAIVDKIERAKAWAVTLAPHVWAIVEALATKGKLTGGQAKLDEFMRRLEEENAKINGSALPAEARAAGAAIAAGISAADSLSRPPEGPAGR